MGGLTNFVGTIVRLLEFVRIGLGRLRFAIKVVYFRKDGGFWLVLLVFWNMKALKCVKNTRAV